jgi:hypothetical protein
MFPSASPGKETQGSAGRFEEVADEIAVLRLECERVLHGRDNQRAGELREVNFSDKAGRDLDAIDLVTVEGGTEIEHGPGLGATQYDHRQLDPACIGELKRPQPAFGPLAADQLKPFNTELFVAVRERPLHVFLRH